MWMEGSESVNSAARPLATANMHPKAEGALKLSWEAPHLPEFHSGSVRLRRGQRGSAPSELRLLGWGFWWRVARVIGVPASFVPSGGKGINSLYSKPSQAWMGCPPPFVACAAVSKHLTLTPFLPYFLTMLSTAQRMTMAMCTLGGAVSMIGG